MLINNIEIDRDCLKDNAKRLIRNNMYKYSFDTHKTFFLFEVLFDTEKNNYVLNLILSDTKDNNHKKPNIIFRIDTAYVTDKNKFMNSFLNNYLFDTELDYLAKLLKNATNKKYTNISFKKIKRYKKYHI